MNIFSFNLLHFATLISFLSAISGCAVYDNSRPGWEEYSKVPQSSAQDVMRLHFAVQGEGKPVILIHGFAANLFSWRHLVSELAQTHKVYLIDLKGFGESPKPDDDAYSVYDQAQLILDFIQREKLSDITLVGHSYGGGVALVTALHLLEQRTASLHKMVLIDNIAYPQETPFFMDMLATPFLGRLLANVLPVNFQVRNVLEKAYYNDSLITEKIVSAYASPLRSNGAIDALVSTARQVFPSDLDQLSKRYSDIHIPTQIIWGQYDEIISPAIAEKLHHNIQHSSLNIIPDCGHIPHEECPELTIPLILRFIRSTEDY